MKKVYIELTDEQKEKLFPIQDALMETNRRGKPGMVIAQVLFTGRDAVAVVGIISDEKAERVRLALSKNPPKRLMTDKMTRRRLEKARA